MSQRTRWYGGLFVLLALALSPSDAAGQIVLGLYELYQGTSGLGRLIIIDDSHPRWYAGLIQVPERGEQANVYLEQWSLSNAGPLLLPHHVIEIRPVTANTPQPSIEEREQPAVAWDAWSVEEEPNIAVTAREIGQLEPVNGLVTRSTAEILQCIACEDELGEGEMAPVGWVQEWLDAEGLPFRQTWWLTDRYEYPSPTTPTRTFLRTLSPEEESAAPRRAISKRIVVDLVPAGVAELDADLRIPVGSMPDGSNDDLDDSVDGTSGPAGCAAGSSPKDGSWPWAFVLAVLGITWRRRRGERS